ncbi:MAG: hypothetical protein ACFE9C_17020, partial [Candidatus Hodarchaeota archaeon]
MLKHDILSGEIEKKILDLFNCMVNNLQTTATCLYGSRVCGYARNDSDYDVLAILDGYVEGIRYCYPSVRSVPVAFLFVDKELFEMDISQGSLGEFVAGRLLSPYIPLINETYLKKREVELKTRVIIEELRNLITQYGELSRGLVFEIEYIILSRLKKRMKVYPPLKYSYLNMLHDDLRNRNLSLIAEGFNKALKNVEDRGIIKFEGEYYSLSDQFIDSVLRRKNVEKAINILDFSQKALKSYLAHGRAGRVSLDILSRELTAKISREFMASMPNTKFEDPKRYLQLRTATGLVTMNERNTVIDIINKYKPGFNVQVKPLGGVLNEVFQAEVGDDRFVIKKFSDWYGFKWFTLNLAVLGTRYFSVSGRERLANEYGMGNYLSSHDFSAQKLLYINIPERVLVKEYIRGVILSDLVKKSNNKNDSIMTQIYFETGEFLSKLHLNDIVLGDSKPENLIYSDNNKIIALDLEQSKKGGNKVWDI